MTFWYKENGNNKLVFGLKNITIDYCTFLSSGVGAAMLDVFFKDLKRYTNIQKTGCPLHASFS